MSKRAIRKEEKKKQKLAKKASFKKKTSADIKKKDFKRYF
jgi:hypothetical protein